MTVYRVDVRPWHAELEPRFVRLHGPELEAGGGSFSFPLRNLASLIQLFTVARAHPVSRIWQTHPAGSRFNPRAVARGAGGGRVSVNQTPSGRPRQVRLDFVDVPAEETVAVATALHRLRSSLSGENQSVPHVDPASADPLSHRPRPATHVRMIRG